MARFYPLYVRRSDGKVQIIVKGKLKELNEPTEEQLDQKPDKNGVSDFYREVGIDEIKSLDWRRKLGGLLARELDPKDKPGQDAGYILAAFPENYRLYEHVKKTEKDGKTQVKNKTHAGGGNDRQDAYLYGHPAGRRKRFRSPADFFPHLLWLCTDESGDPDNCSCKFCSPEDLEQVVPGAKTKAERSGKTETEAKPVVQQTGGAMARHGSAQGTSVKQGPAAPIARPTSVPRQLVPTPLPARKREDQEIDSRYRSFMYRQGELVWFQRGQAWGLGVILRRWLTPDEQFRYIVQPLSYPNHRPLPVTKSTNAEMRPWLAWSVPRFTNDGLNNHQHPPTYENADWQGMAQKRYGMGDMEVDASIMAAKSIDGAYTPFGLNRTTQPESGVEERHYDGIYLGAEKIWTGDPVRLFSSPGTDIMVIHSIVERTRSSSNGQQIIPPSCHLVGDIYSLTTIAHADPNLPTPAAANNNPHLPIRLTEDLADRNAKSILAQRVASYWRLIATQHQVELGGVRGRWYEASLLVPILNPAHYEETARKGEVQEASLLMNSRGDCLNSNRPPSFPRLAPVIVRKETRKEAFGQAVPADAEIQEGIAPPNNVDPALSGGGGGGGGGGSVGSINGGGAMEIDPGFETADAGVNDHLGDEHGAGGGLDEFMNLDEGLDSVHASMPGFEQQYDNQPSQGGFY